jgi:hypothetical protein
MVARPPQVERGSTGAVCRQTVSDGGAAPDLPGPSVLGFLACSAIVRRSAFLDVGGFDDILFFVGEESRASSWRET